MKLLCCPRTSSELAVVESVLRAENIQFFVHNEHFGSLEVGPSIPLLNERSVFVRDEDYGKGLDLISVSEAAGAPFDAPRRVSLLGKLRMALEVLLFGWVLPAPRRRRHAGSE